jgi:hypothetical protein
MNDVTKKEMLMILLSMKYQLETGRKDLMKHLEKTDRAIHVMKDLLQRLDIDTYTEQTYIDTKELKKKGVI